MGKTENIVISLPCHFQNTKSQFRMAYVRENEDYTELFKTSVWLLFQGKYSATAWTCQTMTGPLTIGYWPGTRSKLI